MSEEENRSFHSSHDFVYLKLLLKLVLVKHNMTIAFFRIGKIYQTNQEKKELRKSKDYKITLYIISEVTSHAI